MATTTVAKVGVNVKINGGKTLTLFEGDVVRNLTYVENGDTKTISGAVRVLNATTRANVTVPNTCPPEPYAQDYICMNSVVIDSSTDFDAKLTKIPFSLISDIEELEYDGGSLVTGVGESYKALSEVVRTCPAGGTIELLGGTYEDNLTVEKSVRIYSTSGAELTGTLKFNNPTATTTNPTPAPVYIELEGLVISGNASIQMNNIAGFTMKNCVFGGHTFTATTMPISYTGTNKVKLVIDNNVFTPSSEHVHNLIDIYGALEDGSSISNNIFEGDSYGHNAISLYNADTNATIHINHNHADVSKNILRVGFKGDAHATIEMVGNSYRETDAAPYEGLAVVQPYGLETTTFKNVTINISKTEKPVGQIIYLYNGTNDMQFTTTNKPTIFVDGTNVTNTVSVIGPTQSST